EPVHELDPHGPQVRYPAPRRARARGPARTARRGRLPLPRGVLRRRHPRPPARRRRRPHPRRTDRPDHGRADRGRHGCSVAGRVPALVHRLPRPQGSGGEAPSGCGPARTWRGLPGADVPGGHASVRHPVPSGARRAGDRRTYRHLPGRRILRSHGAGRGRGPGPRGGRQRAATADRGVRRPLRALTAHPWRLTPRLTPRAARRGRPVRGASSAGMSTNDPAPGGPTAAEERSGRTAVTVFPVLILLGAAAGFWLPETFGAVAPAINPLLGVIMFGMGLTLTPPDVRLVATRPVPVLLGVLALFVIMPLAGWLIAVALGLPAELAAGVILV